MKISFERNTLKVTWYKTVTQINLSINPDVLWYNMKGNKNFQNTCSVTSSVNYSISLLDLRGQLRYTLYLNYTSNSDDVNAETLRSSEKGNIHYSLYNKAIIH